MNQQQQFREPVGDFYVHLVTKSNHDHDDGQQQQQSITVDQELTSSTKLLAYNTGKRPTVLHFYDGG